MAIALLTQYSALQYPYSHDFNHNPLSIRKCPDSLQNDFDHWGLFKSYFKDKEGIDISGIVRIHPAGNVKTQLLYFAGTIEILVFELFKNAITNAHFNPQEKTLTGIICEDFYELPGWYCYLI